MTFSITRVRRRPGCRADSRLAWAKIGAKRVFVLTQKGSYADICHDHGLLLAAEIERGVFPEILDTILTETDVDSDLLDTVTQAIYRRLSDEVFAACSDEFRAGAAALGDGLFQALDDPRFSAEDVRDAVVAIDAGNLAEGLARCMSKPLASEAGPTIAYVLGALRRYRRGRAERNVARSVRRNRAAIGARVQRLAHPSHRVGFGCTALGAAPALTADGRGLHARTFDGAFFDWNNFPGLFLIDERATDPSWHRYAAIGTAGLTYPGGISGINDAGLAASIHQMSTLRYDSGRPGQGYAIAPFLQQRILREAASVDEAEAVLTGARHFASWTIVVSDAKAGRAARFEINGGTQQVVRTDLDGAFAQSNHFLAPGMAETHDFFGDLHFTPTFGKWLESRARLATVEQALAGLGGSLDTDAAIGLLASHADGALDGARRSFGRTICKAYGLMGTVARADPERAAPSDEIWMSIGDAAPGPHARFAGFAIDWEALEVVPVDRRPVRRPKTASKDFSKALADYVAAFRTLARPRGDGGALLGRDPDASEQAALNASALVLVDRAARTAEDAGELDFALRYARARLSHACGDYAAAAEDWAYLRALAGMPVFEVHDYERALVLILSAATEFARGRTADANAHLDAGKAMLAELRAQYFPGRRRPHAGLADWEGVADDLRRHGAEAALPEFEFVTVE